jgi:hypothetical protein
MVAGEQRMALAEQLNRRVGEAIQKFAQEQGRRSWRELHYEDFAQRAPAGGGSGDRAHVDRHRGRHYMTRQALAVIVLLFALASTARADDARAPPVLDGWYRCEPVNVIKRADLVEEFVPAWCQGKPLRRVRLPKSVRYKGWEKLWGYTGVGK